MLFSGLSMTQVRFARNKFEIFSNLMTAKGSLLQVNYVFGHKNAKND